MNLRQLKYFVAIAQTGSFNAAADSLHVAQSALSRHMKDLEDELGGALLYRGPRGATLSESGKVLMARSQFILSQLEEARTEVLAHNKELRGTVRLMAPSSIGQLLFEPLVDRFLGQFPKVHLELSEGLWNDAVNRLQTGEADVAIMTGVATDDHIELEPIAYEQVVLVGKLGDSLVGRKSITVGALAGVPLLMAGVTLAGIRRLAPQLSEKFEVGLIVESAPAIRALVESGHGYAIVPRSVLLGKLESRKIASVPTRGFEALRQIGTLRGRPKSRGMRELAAAIRREFTGFVDAGLMRSASGSAVKPPAST